MPENGSRLDHIEAILQQIAEREAALTERHQALAQTVEILAGMQRENEQRFARNEERMGLVMEAMNRLIGIVEDHERRLDDLEGSQ